MAVAFRAGSSSENLTPTIPAGTVAGDLLLLIVHRAAPSSITTPSGYTLIRTDAGNGNNTVTGVFYRAATGTEPGQQSISPSVCWLGAYTGANLNTPVTVTAVGSGSNTGPYDAPSVVSPSAGSMLLCLLGAGTNGGGEPNVSVPTGMSTRSTYVGHTSGFPYATAVGDQQVNAGPTGIKSFTNNSGLNLSVLTESLIVNPAGASTYVPAVML